MGEKAIRDSTRVLSLQKVKMDLTKVDSIIYLAIQKLRRLFGAALDNGR